MKIGYLMQAGVPDIQSDRPSGPAVHVRRVIEELDKLGHQVRILAVFNGEVYRSDNLVDFVRIMPPGDNKGVLRLVERIVRRIQHELRLPYAALFETLRFVFACAQELRGYDLLYERMGWFGYGGSLSSRLLRIPLVLEVNGDHPSELAVKGMALQGAQRQLSMALMKKATRWASHTVATGEGWRKRHIERWSIDPQTVTVIENGSELVNLLSSRQLRAFNLNPALDDVITIVYSGGFDPRQGVMVMIRAVARVINDNIPVRLLLLGTGDGVPEAQQLVQQFGIASHVIFTGQLGAQEYATHLADADIGISPYCGREEYSGLKLLDYKAAGLAIIASGEKGQPAIIEHGKTGWIVPPCDENALYQAIARLSTNRELVRSLGRASRIEAERLHSWKNTAQQLNILFDHVIKDFHNN